MQSHQDVEPAANGLFAFDSPERLAALRHYTILNTPPEPVLDRITELAAWFFSAPMAAITLVDGDRVWLKSHYGLAPDQIDHEMGLWSAAILTDDIYCITDASEDPQISADPLVTGSLGLRFCAAVPLRAQDGLALGALSVIDSHPRGITEREKEFLRRMAGVVVELIELRLSALIRREPSDGWTDGWTDGWADGWTDGWTDGWADGWAEPEGPAKPQAPTRRFHIGFNPSLRSKSEQRQLEWLGRQMIGDSPAMRATLDLVRLAITGQANSILLLGETGTGKGLCARAIHEGSGSRGRFIEVNCG